MACARPPAAAMALVGLGQLGLGAGGHGDARAVLCELQGDGAADTAATAGDQGGLVVQMGHGVVLCRRGSGSHAAARPEARAAAGRGAWCGTVDQPATMLSPSTARGT